MGEWMMNGSADGLRSGSWDGLLGQFIDGRGMG